jgi:hypothetical protein
MPRYVLSVAPEEVDSIESQASEFYASNPCAAAYSVAVFDGCEHICIHPLGDGYEIDESIVLQAYVVKRSKKTGELYLLAAETVA